MDQSLGDSAPIYALRLGLEPQRVVCFEVPVTIAPSTLVIRAATPAPAPLIICLHPARTTEFQFAQALRGLVALQAHLAFPRGLHAHEVDLGGAQTVGYAWYHYTGDNPAFRESLDFANAYLDRVAAHLLDELPVDRRAVYILGAGTAGAMAAVHAAARADTFSGIVVLGGELWPEVLADFLPTNRHLPLLWLFRPRRRGARAVDPEACCEELRAVGLAVDFEPLQDPAESWTEEEGAIIAWLSQKAGVPLQQPA